MEAMRSEFARRDEAAAFYDPLSSDRRPLVVDVEEVLLHGNLHVESAFSALAHRFQTVFGWVDGFGGPRLKQKLAEFCEFDPSRLLFDQAMVTFLLQIMGEGRPVYLSSERYDDSLLHAIAQHLGVFVAWPASATPEAPRGTEGEGLAGGFDYVGRATAPLPLIATRIAPPVSRENRVNADWRTWAKLLRVHQYAKNALVMVPLLTAHQFAWLPALKAAFAVAAFSLCASSAYVLNDLIDVKADRAHPTKCNRPIAFGAISPTQAVIAMMLALAGAVAIAGSISLAFLGTLLGYLALTTLYSFYLKRIAIADVVTLAILYTIRVIAGAVAIHVAMSEWLFAFSLFMFMSLALVKRHVELARQPNAGRLMARDYQADDKSMIAILAAASGFNSVVVFTLYISSETNRALYTHSELLWVICPVLMFWIARVMLLAHRGLIDDDPVIFALGDRVSWLALGTICSIMLAAI